MLPLVVYKYCHHIVTIYCYHRVYTLILSLCVNGADYVFAAHINSKETQLTTSLPLKPIIGKLSYMYVCSYQDM